MFAYRRSSENGGEMYEVDFIPAGDAGRHGDAVALRFTRPDSGEYAHVIIDAGTVAGPA
jgi:hypothetical protein